MTCEDDNSFRNTFWSLLCCGRIEEDVRCHACFVPRGNSSEREIHASIHRRRYHGSIFTNLTIIALPSSNIWAMRKNKKKTSVLSYAMYKVGPMLRELAPMARRSQEAGFTQPMAHLIAHLHIQRLKGSGTSCVAQLLCTCRFHAIKSA